MLCQGIVHAVCQRIIGEETLVLTASFHNIEVVMFCKWVCPAAFDIIT
jgi:hypothetical protein